MLMNTFASLFLLPPVRFIIRKRPIISAQLNVIFIAKFQSVLLFEMYFSVGIATRHGC